MYFFKNLQGLRKSQIVMRLVNEYFSITPRELEREIFEYEDDKARNLIDPVYIDKDGKHT